MQELKEAKFPRTGKEYILEKSSTGFNLRLIDLDDTLQPISKTFSQLLELSQSGQIVFTGFEEKKNEAELILLNCIHETEIADCKLQIANLTEEKITLKAEYETGISSLQKEMEELKEERDNLKGIIKELKVAAEA